MYGPLNHGLMFINYEIMPLRLEVFDFCGSLLSSSKKKFVRACKRLINYSSKNIFNIPLKSTCVDNILQGVGTLEFFKKINR